MSQKLKILALHGYTQNAEKFKEKTFPFQRKIKKYANFIFITAPHIAAPNEFSKVDKSEEYDHVTFQDLDNKLEIGTSNEQTKTFENVDYTDSYAWYLRQINENGQGYIYKGLKESLDYLEQVFKTHGPFDGVFGFSQGGCVVGLLCDLQQRKLTKHIKFDFAIMASAFKHESDDYYDTKLTIPSLHIYGENDKQITSDMSLALIQCFENPVVGKHSGGHYIPGNNSLKSEFDLFFKAQWSTKYDKNT